jgi:hypothetical protein
MNYLAIVSATALVAVALHGSSEAGGGKDLLARQLESLALQDLRKVGCVTIEKEYERLLVEHAENPDRAAVMIRLALLSSGEPGDEKKFRSWLEAASKAATPGSQLWCEARERLFDRIQWSDPEKALSLAQELLAHPANEYFRLRALYALQELAMHRKDYDEASRWNKEVAAWLLSDEKDAKNPHIGEMISIARLAACNMIGMWAKADLPIEERKRRIAEVLETWKNWHYATNKAYRSLARMEKTKSPGFADYLNPPPKSPY